jgi:transcriptional regulator of met regulon
MAIFIIIVIIVFFLISRIQDSLISRNNKKTVLPTSFEPRTKNLKVGSPSKDFIGTGTSSIRPARFKQLVKGGYYNQQTLKSITNGSTTGSRIIDVVLRHDPSNKFDSNAMQVQYKGKLLGFIPKEETQKFVTAHKSYTASNQEMLCEAFISWFTKSSEIDADIYLDTSTLSL